MNKDCVGMSAELIHLGYISIIKEATKLEKIGIVFSLTKLSSVTKHDPF